MCIRDRPDERELLPQFRGGPGGVGGTVQRAAVSCHDAGCGGAAGRGLADPATVSQVRGKFLQLVPKQAVACRTAYNVSDGEMVSKDTVTAIPYGRPWDKIYGTDNPNTNASLYDDVTFLGAWKAFVAAAVRSRRDCSSFPVAWCRRRLATAVVLVVCRMNGLTLSAGGGARAGEANHIRVRLGRRRSAGHGEVRREDRLSPERRAQRE